LKEQKRDVHFTLAMVVLKEIKKQEKKMVKRVLDVTA